MRVARPRLELGSRAPKAPMLAATLPGYLTAKLV